MRRHEKPINETATRIAEIRSRLTQIHQIRRARDLTEVESYEYQKLNDEINKLLPDMRV